MTDKIDFDTIAEEAVANEPIRKDNHEQPDNVVGEVDQDESKTVEVNAFDLVPIITEIFATFWIRFFGESKKAPLTTEEKEGVNALLCQGCEMYDLRGNVTGGRGFILALVMKLLGLVVPRLQDSEIREHIFNQQPTKEEKDDGGIQPVHTPHAPAAQSRDAAFLQSKGIGSG